LLLADGLQEDVWSASLLVWRLIFGGGK